MSTKRQIRITINPDGSTKIDNAGNPDEKKILDELSELSALLNGQKTGFKVEQHVHNHLTAHQHDAESAHIH